MTRTAGSPSVSLVRGRPGLVLAVMCAGMFLVLLDVTVVNVALPSIRSGLAAGVAGVQWIVDGYAVPIASLLLAGGTLGDRIGHGRVVMVGLALFGIASVCCGFAPMIGALIAARALQGIGAALLLPGSLAVITDTFPGRAEQARALGIWAGVSSLALPAGPLLGGLLVTAGGWRSVFLINIPMVVAALVLIPRLVRLSPGHGVRRLDGPGLVTAIIALAALVFAVIEGGEHGVDAAVVIASTITVLSGAGFWWAQRRAPWPMIPLELWRRSAFTGANSVALLMNLTVNGTIFVTTLYLQDVRGLSPMLAGCVLLPLFVPLAACAPLTGRLTARYGPRLPIMCGIVLAGIGAAFLFMVPVQGSLLTLLPVLLGLGIGAGLITAAVVAAAVRAVPAERSGLASGVNNTARQTGTALGAAIFGAVAGSPASTADFVDGLHRLGVIGAGLWFVALVISAMSLRSS
jgi:DHA2 family methylenomycin A resistance protein-like MFS transporter